MLTLAVVVGCGGVTKFSDTTAIAIKGPAAPPPAVAAAPKRVEVKEDRIELNEKIQFAVDSAKILEGRALSIRVSGGKVIVGGAAVIAPT